MENKVFTFIPAENVFLQWHDLFKVMSLQLYFLFILAIQSRTCVHLGLYLWA